MTGAPKPDGTGRRWWRSLEEWADSEAFAETIKAEFPSLAQLFQVDRRELLRVMGASLALAGVTACKPARSDEVVPFVDRPDDFGENRVSHFATAVLTDGFAQPVIAQTSAGRPVKLEGNPEHPASRGASSFLTQAALLDLYDPDRSQQPLVRGSPATWADFDAQMTRRRSEWETTGGDGVRLLVAPTTSPTLIAQIAELKSALPDLQVHVFDPLTGYGGDPSGRALGGAQRSLKLDSARVVVSLDDDFLGPGPAQVVNAASWATGRGSAPKAKRIRLFMAEPTPSLTGANAQQKISVAPSRMPLLARAIAAKLGAGGAVAGLTAEEFGWASSAAQALASNAGSSLLTVARHSPAELHALAAVVNRRLGNDGKTLSYSEPLTLRPDGSFVDLCRDMQAMKVRALFMLGTNPAYASPGDIDFTGLLGRVPLTVHSGLHVDETAVLCDWHLPTPHSLEDWSDSRAVDGLATIMQPVIQPLYDTRSIHTLVAAFTSDGGAPNARALVRKHWAGRLGEDEWNAALKLGFVPGTEAKATSVSPNPGGEVATKEAGPTEIEIVIRPDPTIRGGEGANNGWLQELPKPLTKVTWDNVVAISPAMARGLGIGGSGESADNNARLIEIEADGKVIRGPVWVLPGQPDGVATVYLGYGRREVGRVGRGVGYDAYPLRSMASPWSRTGSIRASDSTVPVATTQRHHVMEKEDELPLVAGPDEKVAKPVERATIYPEWKDGEPAWGMVIDNDLCIGCNACITACQSENNVPVVGKDQVYMGREMHWLRVSRLHSGEPESPATVFQPVPCMHCEQAPCEMGCPVHATVHSPDGLNLMVYNRCIGTRTCSSFCPYKVRRFNWFDYTSEAPAPIEAQRNPEVTVRGRGVMEKCTYCIQRIETAKVQADIDNRDVRDGEVKTACQQACPTNAITFGNLGDAGSAVAGQRSSPRNYALLGELGTRPRTTYLAKIFEDDA